VVAPTAVVDTANAGGEAMVGMWVSRSNPAGFDGPSQLGPNQNVRFAPAPGAASEIAYAGLTATAKREANGPSDLTGPGGTGSGRVNEQTKAAPGSAGPLAEVREDA